MRSIGSAKCSKLPARSGATSLGGVRFDLKDRSRLEREALRLAVADARAKADAIATGAGRTIDRIVRIEEQGVSGGPVPVMYRRDAAQVAGASRRPSKPPDRIGHGTLTAV